MKKHIATYTVFVLLLLAIIYTIQTAIDISYQRRTTHKFSQLLNHKIDDNIMFFGSSVVYHELDPAVFQKAGMSAYNMGWDGTFFVQYNALIREYLTYSKKCRCIVIGCSFDNLSINEYITRPDLYLAYLNNNYVYEALHEVEPQKIFRARYIPGFKFTLLNKSFYTELLYGKKIKDIDYKGFEPVESEWNVSDSLRAFTPSVSPRVYAQLQSTINLATSKGIKVVMMMMPVHEDGYRMIDKAEGIKSKYKVLQRDGVYFIDYTTDSICRLRDYFYNYSHLNAKGAALFSEKVSNDLMKILK